MTPSPPLPPYRLQHLYLGGNKLTRVPEEIGSLARLQSLALCDNQIMELPDAVASLSQLKSLQLHSNQLQTLPRALLELDSIMSLSLRKNPLVARFVREMDFSLHSLQELSARAVRNCGVYYRGLVPPHLERWVCLGEVCHVSYCHSSPVINFHPYPCLPSTQPSPKHTSHPSLPHPSPSLPHPSPSLLHPSQVPGHSSTM